MGRGKLLRAYAAAAVLVSLTTSAGCGGAEPAARPSSPSTTLAPAAPATPTSYADRCGATGATRRALTAIRPAEHVVRAKGSALHVTTVGSGPTVVVLLHQVSGGACGYDSLLAAAGRDRRFRFVVPDLCGSGESTCASALDADQPAQARLVLDDARARFHPRRLVLAGCSMGGAITLRVATGYPGLTAAVDVSGPAAWYGPGPMRHDVADGRVPELLVFDPADDLPTDRLARQAARAAGPRVAYLRATRGHGWANLTDARGALTRTARTILDFAARA